MPDYLEKLQNLADVDDVDTSRENLRAAADIQAPFAGVAGTVGRHLSEFLRGNSVSILDFHDPANERPLVGDGVTDCWEAMKNAAESGLDIFFPPNVGIIAYSVPPEIKISNVTWFGLVSQRSPGAATPTNNTTARTCALKLLTSGTTNSPMPFIDVKEEGFVCVGLLFEGLGPSEKQIGIRAKKEFGLNYPRKAACDLYVADCRFTEVETAIQSWGWGVRIENLSTGIVRTAVDLQWPDENTFVGTEGQSFNLGFRQIQISISHAHATTYLVRNDGPNASKLNGFQLGLPLADTGSQILKGTFVNTTVVGAVSTNATDVEPSGYTPKRSTIRLEDGSKNVVVVGAYLGGYASGGEKIQPSYAVQLIGSVEVKFVGCILGYCNKSAVQMDGSGLKKASFSACKVVSPCSDNETTQSPSNIFELQGGTAHLVVSDLQIDVDNHANKGSAAVFGANGPSQSSLRITAVPHPVSAHYPLAQTGVLFNADPFFLGSSTEIAVASTTNAGSTWNGSKLSMSRGSNPVLDIQRTGTGGPTTRYFLDTTLKGEVRVSTAGLTISGLPGPYASDAAAATAGVSVGELYRVSGGAVAWRVT